MNRLVLMMFLLFCLILLSQCQRPRGPPGGQQRQGGSQRESGSFRPPGQNPGNNQDQPEILSQLNINVDQLKKSMNKELIGGEFQNILQQQNLTEQEKSILLKQAQDSMNNTLIEFSKIEQIDEAMFRDILISVPFVLAKLNDTQKQQYFNDYIYFLSLPKDRQEQLTEYVAYNISQLLNDSDQSGQQYILNSIDRYDLIINYDKQYPNQSYGVPDSWRTPQNKQNLTEFDVNQYLNNKEVSNPILDWFQQNRSQQNQVRQENLNTTIEKSINNILPKDQNYSEQDKKQLSDYLSGQIINFNQTVRQVTKDYKNSTQQQNDELKGLQQNSQVPNDSHVGLIIGFIILFVLILGFGYFLGRRKQLRMLQYEVGHDQSVEINIDGKQQNREDRGVSGFIQ